MPTLDLNSPGAKKLFSERIGAEVDKVIVENNPPSHSWKLKPSSLGGDCLAREWFRWRWVKLIQYKARNIRLKQRGKDQENNVWTWLRASGWEVLDVDPARVKANKPIQQYKVEDFDDHLSGYLDAIIKHPVFSEGKWILGEVKQFKKDRFNAFVKKGLIISDPDYYGQVCIYMEKYNLPYAIVFGICKDDDEIHIEIIQANNQEFVRCMQRGGVIINSPTRPTRIAESPTHYVCKMCDYSDVCHSGAPMDKNCRSCRFAQPAEKGTWLCGHYGLTIPHHVIYNGCENHIRVM